MSQNQSSRFLGEEKIGRLMLKFSIPCILSQLVSSLYNIVDQIFIGNSELSTLGNAATGVVFPIFIIAQAIAWCFGDGCAAYLNICQGRNDSENAHRAIGASITLSFILGVILTALVYAFKVPILMLFGASENSLPYAIEYLDIVLAMVPIFILCNMMNSVIRADGSPNFAMGAMLVGAVTNIILDPLFIFLFKWGMAGAALATAIGQGVTFVITLIYFTRTKTFKLTLQSFMPTIRSAGNVVKLGVSTLITQLAIVIVAVSCNVQLAKYGADSVYGTDIPIAIIGIQSKVFTVVLNLVVGMALGCQPVISFNMGARKFDRVKELYRKIMLFAITTGLAFTLLFELAPDFIVGLFGVPSNIPNPEQYWIFGAKTFRIFMSLVTISCVIKVNSIFFQAAGSPGRAVVASMIRDVICFVPLIYILPAITGDVETILYCAPISDLIAMAVTGVITISFMKSLDSSAKSDAGEAVLRPSKKGVILTIAREHGSSGKQIGKLVAEKMKIPFYYKEMTALAAQESGLDKEFIADINTNSPAILHSLYLSTDVILRAVTAQEKVIKKIAEQGSCVIVGRAADYVLRDDPDLVRVFIYAPEECRTERIMAAYGDSREEAKRHVRRSDEARASYYKSISGLTWGDRRNYDLMLDSSIGLEESAELICKFIKEKTKSV